MNHTHSLLSYSVDAMKSNLCMASTLLQFSRQLRQSQIEHIDASTHEIAEMMRQLDGIDDVDHLRNVASALLGMQVERVGAYWNSIGKEWAAGQTELALQFQTLYDKSAEDWCQDVVQIQSDLLNESSTVLKPLLESGIYFSGGGDENPADGHGGTNGTGFVLSERGKVADKRPARSARAAGA